MGRGSDQKRWVGVCRMGRAPTGLKDDPLDTKGEKKLSGHKMGCEEGKNDHQLSGHVA